MIEQDAYWRRDLLKLGQRLGNRYSQRRWSARTLYSVEKEVFLSCYIIRKLLESGKADRAVSSLNYVITKYPITEGVEPSTNPKTFAFTYQLSKGSKAALSLKRLCDQFIHSHIFSPFTLKPLRADMLGIFFSSYSHSSVGVYYIPLLKVVEMIISAGRNRPVKLKLHRKTDGRFRVISR